METALVTSAILSEVFIHFLTTDFGIAELPKDFTGGRVINFKFVYILRETSEFKFRSLFDRDVSFSELFDFVCTSDKVEDMF